MSTCLVQVTITAAQGGHSGPVQVLLPFKQFLLSADWLGTMKVWDMASGQCVQTMQQAHKEPIMGILPWEVSSRLESYWAVYSIHPHSRAIRWIVDPQATMRC